MIKLKIDQGIYYKNKSKFVSLYKKLGMRWVEDSEVGDVWTNLDKSSYLRKIPEEGSWKRFYAHNVPDMVDFLKSIGAVEVDGEPFEQVVQKVVEPVLHEDYPGYKGFHELLDSMPDNWGVVWGDSLLSSRMSDEFKSRWRELEVKYKDYKFDDFLKDIKSKNKTSKDDDEIVEVRRRIDDDIIPKKVKGKKMKDTKMKKVREINIKPDVPVKKQDVEFKKKTFKVSLKKAE